MANIILLFLQCFNNLIATVNLYYGSICITCFILVSCTSLSEPSNGMINCSLGGDGIPSYEDTCSFTCNTGYELTGSESRTCQSDGSWSGSIAMCTRGKRNVMSVM